MYFIPKKHSGFTLVEILLWMTIFAIWLTGIYLLLGSSIMNYSYSRSEIIVTGLLREQGELVRNIRENNILLYTSWDNAKITPSGTGFASWVYIVENNFSESWVTINQSHWTIQTSGVVLQSIDTTTGFSTLKEKFEKTQLFLDSNSRYTHTRTSTWTTFSSYSILSPIGYMDAWVYITPEKDGKPQWYIIDTRVIVRVDADNYREYDAKTAVTDWVK